MKIFLTGSTGFIGRRLATELRNSGHEVVCSTRDARAKQATATGIEYRQADFTTDFDPAVWVPRLKDIDVVINAVGIIRERGRQTFEAIHLRTPQALFSAAATAGVRRVIQISALGADAQARSRYHLTKKAADDFLATLPIDWVIVQPSLVYGPGGTSARLFTMMASLPCIPVPGRGDQLVQPIHIDDLTRAIVTLAESEWPQRRRIPLVGPAPLPFREFLARLRRAMGMTKTCFIPVPEFLLRTAARVSALLPGSLLDRETLDMLLRGNTADPSVTLQLLRRNPQPVEAFISRDERETVRLSAKLQWLLPPLRWSIALVWIASGILSSGVYPIHESYALLARTGMPDSLAPIALYGAAFLDLILGTATLILRRRQILWLAQIAVIVGYTLIISLKLPEFWAHPFGPVLKNLPLLAAIWMLYELERR